MERKIDGMVTISLLQNDGRLNGEKFPFPKTINKVCLLIFKTQQKRRVTSLNNLLEKTLIVNRRDSILELDLKDEDVFFSMNKTKLFSTPSKNNLKPRNY